MASALSPPSSVSSEPGRPHDWCIRRRRSAIISGYVITHEQALKWAESLRPAHRPPFPADPSMSSAVRFWLDGTVRRAGAFGFLYVILSLDACDEDYDDEVMKYIVATQYIQGDFANDNYLEDNSDEVLDDDVKLKPIPMDARVLEHLRKADIEPICFATFYRVWG